MFGKAVFKGLVPISAGGQEIDALVIAQTRTTFSLLLLVPLVLALYGRGILRVPRPQLWRCLLMGAVGLSGANFFYYYAIDKTTVATAIVVQYTAPVWVLLYMVARGRQRATWPRVAGVVTALLGIALCIHVLRVGSTAPYISIGGLKLHTLGLLAAVGASFSFAFYNILGGDLVHALHRWTVFLYALLGSTLFWLLVNPPWKLVAAHYSKDQWLFLLFFAVFSMLLPFGSYLAGLQFVDVTKAMVIACLEPVFAISLAAAFVGEAVEGTQVAGMVMVLAATIIVEMPDKSS